MIIIKPYNNYLNFRKEADEEGFKAGKAAPSSTSSRSTVPTEGTGNGNPLKVYNG